jgi:hypothetical protein
MGYYYPDFDRQCAPKKSMKKNSKKQPSKVTPVIRPPTDADGQNPFFPGDGLRKAGENFSEENSLTKGKTVIPLVR